MNVLSQNNTLLSINGGGEGGDMWTSGLEFSGSVITGYSGSAFGGDGCHCDSAAIASAGSAAATAWVDEQGYITALPEMDFVETSALNYTNDGMISGISGNPIHAMRADSASLAESAAYAESTQYATSALSASYSESAGRAESANWASSATNALNSEYANISNRSVTALYAENDINGNSITATYLTTGSFSGLPYVQNSALDFTNDGKISAISGSGFFAEGADSASSAITAIYVASGWETNTAGQITGYSGTAIAGGGGGGGAEYTGIAPIVVNNAEYKISADTAALGVEYPLYFAEDSETATVIAIHDSAISGKDWTDEINSASAYAYSAATANQTEYSAGPNIDITSHVVSGKDWTDEINSASAYAYSAATADALGSANYWNSNYDTVYGNSANWDESYLTVYNNSANWGTGGVITAYTAHAVHSGYSAYTGTNGKIYSAADLDVSMSGPADTSTPYIILNKQIIRDVGRSGSYEHKTILSPGYAVLSSNKTTLNSIDHQLYGARSWLEMTGASAYLRGSWAYPESENYPTAERYITPGTDVITWKAWSTDEYPIITAQSSIDLIEIARWVTANSARLSQ